MKNIKIINEIDVEIRRKLIHFFLVLFLTTVFHFIGFQIIPFISLLLFVGILISELCIRGKNIPIISFGIKKFDRPENVLFSPGLGVFTLLIGILTIIFIGFIFKLNLFLIELSILLNASDTFSTIFGIRFGKTKWIHNQRKTIEGTAAFFISGMMLTLIYFQDATTLFLPLILSLVETLPRFDDNISISTISLLFLKILGK